jgi:hypothetical protein
MLSEGRIIFIVGNSRSGTTMLSRILGKNENVHSFQEIHFLERMVPTKKLRQKINEKEGKKLLCKLIGIQTEGFYKQENLTSYEAEANYILHTLPQQPWHPFDIYKQFLFYWAKKYGKEIPCEQTPKNIYYLKEILWNLTDAKVINMVRDPRSVLLSQKNKWRRKFLGEEEMPFFESLRAWTLYHPITMAQLWVSAVRASQDKQSENVLTVKFEDFLSSPDKIIEIICAFCGIKYGHKMLLIPQVGSSLGNDAPDKLGIDKNKISTWKNGGLSNAEIYIAQKITKKFMEEMNYQIIEVKPNMLIVWYYYVLYPFKLSVAILLNLGRMKNVLETLKRRLGWCVK